MYLTAFTATTSITSLYNAFATDGNISKANVGVCQGSTVTNCNTFSDKDTCTLCNTGYFL